VPRAATPYQSAAYCCDARGVNALFLLSLPLPQNCREHAVTISFPIHRGFILPAV